MAQNDIGIDLGTTTIIIAQEGQGVVLNQPSVVAVDTRKNSVLEVGDKALAMVGRTPNYISAIFPLKDGVISDHTMTRELICRFVNQVYSSHMVKPRVAVCVPAAITGIESDAVVEAVMAAGARQVYLIDEPIAAALGSGIDITVPDGRMIIDIGGGTTDIAVLSLGGKVKATSVRVAGNHYDDEILKHVRNKFSIAIGQRTAEQLKKNVACCPQKADFNETMEVKGRSLLNRCSRLCSGSLGCSLFCCLPDIHAVEDLALQRDDRHQQDKDGKHQYDTGNGDNHIRTQIHVLPPSHLFFCGQSAWLRPQKPI